MKTHTLNASTITVEMPATTAMMKDLQCHLPEAVHLYALALHERGGVSAQNCLWAAQRGPQLDKAPLFSGITSA